MERGDRLISVTLKSVNIDPIIYTFEKKTKKRVQVWDIVSILLL